MGRRYRWRASTALVGLWLGLQIMVTPPLASSTPERCRPDLEPDTDLQMLADLTQAAGLQEASLKRLLLIGFSEPEGSDNLRGIFCIVLKAQYQGLPLSPLLQKLDEGLAKRVTLARIRSALARLAEDMAFARLLLKRADPSATSNPPDQALQRLAATMALGLSRDELAQLFGPDYQAPPSMRIIAAEIAGFGRKIGFDPQLLAAIVSSGLNARAFTSEWAYFIKIVNEARKRGLTDQEITDAAQRILAQQGSLEELMTALRFTPRDKKKGPGN